MRYVFTTMIIFILNYQIGFAQKSNFELVKFIQTELHNGDYTFQIMTNKIISTIPEEGLLIDENGKIGNSNLDIENIREVPVIQFMPTGSVKLRIKFKDSVLIIQPIENSFCPIILINTKSSIASVDGYTLVNMQEIYMRNKTNVFKSEWNGFQWRSDITNESFSIKPKLTVGKIEESGKLYIEIVWIEKGEKMHYRLLN